MAIIEVKNLSKSYEFYRKEPGFFGSVKSFFKREMLSAEAVKHISFSIEAGELVGFLGPNGAGKTTTLKMLSGILHPTLGEARVLGYEPWNREEEYQKQFSLVMGQKNQLLLDLPPHESFLLNRSLYEIPHEKFAARMDELVTLFQVEEILHVPVRKLSLGQRMKCELIAALLHDPKVLFLDEPTIGLDVVAQKNIRDFIKKYNRQNKTTILLTSHYMEDIKELCDRVIIINLGEIVYDGKLAALMHEYAPYKLLTVTFNEPGIERGDAAQFGEIEKFNRYRAKIRVSREHAKEVAVALLSSSLPVDDILLDEVPVDDVIRVIFHQGEKK